MDPMASPATSITATILATVTEGRYPGAERRRSATSTRTRLGTDEATSLRIPATTLTRSTVPDFRREEPEAESVKPQCRVEEFVAETNSSAALPMRASRYLLGRSQFCGFLEIEDTRATNQAHTEMPRTLESRFVLPLFH
jgi:hypothetical protein